VRGLSRFRVLSFDCYGTLIDWETGIAAALADFARRAGLDREALLALFARHESAQQRATPELRYPELLARVLERMAAEAGMALRPGEAKAFGRSVPDWPAFTDSPEALAELKRHAKLVILSNVDRASFAQSARRLRVEFDLVLTAEDIGSYKPDPRNFEALARAVREMGFAPEEHLHVAQSLFHDIVPAGRAGMRTAWIDRRAGRPGGATPPPPETVQPDFTFRSLAELAATYRREMEAMGSGGVK